MSDQVQNIFDFLPEETNTKIIAETFKGGVLPLNPVTGQLYKGQQVNNLLAVMDEFGYCGQFAGFKQWKEQGRSVKKGEKAIKILMPFKKVIDGKEQLKFFSRCIFAIEQTECIKDED